MNDKVTHLNVERAIKAGDSRLVSPLEQLKDLVQEIETGKINPDQVFVAMLTFDKKVPGRWKSNWVCANMTMRDIIALLEITKDNILHGQ